ncbi:hypothetical protein BAE40_13125 [Mesorhizobium loti]|nr:hypothetical protein BAE40_13125 [Mesorhizobium loti]
MIIARRFEAADHRLAIRLQNLDQPVMLCAGVENRQPAAALVAGGFNQDFIADLGDIDRYQHRIGGYNIWAGRGRSLRNGL